MRARHGIDGAYLPLPVRPERFETAVRSLVDLGFAGANVTIPHKEAAFALCDTVSEVARRAGSVNTLVFRDGESNRSVETFVNLARSIARRWNAAPGADRRRRAR